MAVRNKIKEWFRRYMPAELLSTAVTMLSALLMYHMGGSLLAVALAGTWAGNISFYGYMLVADVVRSVRLHHNAGRQYTGRSMLADLGALAVEFGLAEVIDSLLVRPLLMYYIPLMVGSVGWGILFAKLMADVCFYIPAIIGYEVSRKRVKK